MTRNGTHGQLKILTPTFVNALQVHSPKNEEQVHDLDQVLAVQVYGLPSLLNSMNEGFIRCAFTSN